MTESEEFAQIKMDMLYNNNIYNKDLDAYVIPPDLLEIVLEHTFFCGILTEWANNRTREA